VTYLEVPVSGVADARTLLQRDATDERTAVSRAGTAAPATAHIEVLQEIDRPERWVLLEWADSPGQLKAIKAAGSADLIALQGLLVAPIDQRSNHPLPGPGGATDTAAEHRGAADDQQPALRDAVYSLVHLDIGSPQQPPVIDAVAALVKGARQARGNLRAEAWQQNSRANHYALLFVWRSRADRDAFTGAASVRRFRSTIGPLLGSPYDERLYRLTN
jgi:quinol monooxygenase YgiN